MALTAAFRPSRCLRKVSVVLRDDLPGIGSCGEQRFVAAGFMRNYLFPKGKAVYSTPENIARYQISTDERVNPTNKANEVLREQASKLAKKFRVPLEIKRNSNDGKACFPGNVTAQNIADTVKKRLGVNIDPEHIRLLSDGDEFPLDTINSYPLKYSIGGKDHADAEVYFTLNVVKR